MAIYHMEAKMISRGSGRSAAAASAYMSCSAIYNDYDGVQHDYTKKQGLVWEKVFLPENAPTEWQDRAVLWNAVETAEKSKDSRLAREFVVALPIELSREHNIALLSDFIQQQFVSDGMCADVVIHDTDGHNPHAHILLTVRPLDENGKWQYKTEKEYLCIKNGIEQGFTAAEFKLVKADGWEKQYLYYISKKKKAYLPVSQAEGLERADKHPKSTKYGRQNPITARWNSDEQLVAWRAAWAETVNHCLEKNGIEERVDHRSHADRGLDEQPTIHEGVTAHALEKQGIISDRCEFNRQIKADNALLCELKASVKQLVKAVQNTIPAIAAALETMRKNIIMLYYMLLYRGRQRESVRSRLASLKSNFKQYRDIAAQIKEKAKERKTAMDEKKALPVIAILRSRQLTQRIAKLSEELEELRSEKLRLLHAMRYPEDTNADTMQKDISHLESELSQLMQQEKRCNTELTEVMNEYAQTKQQSEQFDPMELYLARQKIRGDCERSAAQQLSEKLGDDFSSWYFSDAVNETELALNERWQDKQLRRKLRESQRQNRPKPTKRRDDWVR